MDQGPLTHTNGGSPAGSPRGGSHPPILSPAGQESSGPGTPLWRGGWTPPAPGAPGAGGPKLSPPGDGGHLTDFVAN